jgi:hypothetical protein
MYKTYNAQLSFTDFSCIKLKIDLKPHEPGDSANNGILHFIFYRLFLNAELQTSFVFQALLYNFLSLNVVQKNHNGAQMVMAQMQIAGVKPDSETFSYLIMNCESEENISKV